MAVLPKDRVQSAKEWLDLMSDPAFAEKAASKRKSRRLSRRTQPVAMSTTQTSKKSKLPLVMGTVAGLALVAGAGVFLAPQLSPGDAERDVEVSSNAASPSQDFTQDNAVTGIIAATEGADLELPADLGVPAEPEIAAAPQEPDVAEQLASLEPEPAAPELPPMDTRQGIVEAGVITSGWTVEMPFTQAADENGLIESVGDNAPAAIPEGQRLVAIDGQPVEGFAQAMEILRAGSPEDGGRSLMASLTVVEADGTAEITVPVELPVVYETTLANGFAFRSQFADSRWITRVVDVPASQQDGLRSGDILIALLPENEEIADIVTLRTLLAREIEAGSATLRMAVRRDGSMWVGEMTTGAGAG